MSDGAPWQVVFDLVPRRALGAAPGRLTADVLRAGDWWSVHPLVRGHAERLAAAGFVGRGSGDRQTYGADEGNRIDVESRDGQPVRVTAAVDVRRLDSKFGATLLDLARASDAVLVRQDGTIVETTIAAFAGALRGSAAWRFANEPVLDTSVDEE